MSEKSMPMSEHQSSYESWRATRPVPEGWLPVPTGLDDEPPDLVIRFFTNGRYRCNVVWLKGSVDIQLTLAIRKGPKGISEPIDEEEARAVVNLLAPDMPLPHTHVSDSPRDPHVFFDWVIAAGTFPVPETTNT